MVKHSVIRELHAWGVQQTDPFTTQTAADAVKKSASSVYMALCALANAGFASKSKGAAPATGGVPTTLYFLTGSTAECAARFSDGLGELPNPPPLYERVSSIFDYGQRCAVTAGWEK